MADVYKDEVQADESGRILHIKTPEHVTADHPSAVQALEVQRRAMRLDDILDQPIERGASRRGAQALRLHLAEIEKVEGE